MRGAKGNMVPLASLAEIKYSSGPETLDRFNNLPAVKIFGSAKPGYSSGEAIERMEKIAKATLPPDFSFDWGGASYQEKKSSGTSGIAIGLAAIMVFLILAAQYEKWSLPLSVLLALPFGTFGALAAIWIKNGLSTLSFIVPGMQLITGQIGRLTNDVYFQIGLVTLLGLAAKNAILIVEFAVMKHHEGMSASAAALEAARLRFRPILMTSLAFILGVLPLAVSTGAGAGARHSVGTGVMGGMIAATFLAIFFVPMFFKLISDRHLTEKRSSAELRAEIAEANRKREASVE
ncbi:MAG TPA: efflux RND transporter permease subunit, partial [Burkholderiales bacterium]|nr:efflux RND transporter permease subunit [Burkholderiales bacterium]